MIIQKNNVVLFSNFQTKSFKIWCKNTGNKTVNLEPENCARNLKPPRPTDPKNKHHEKK